MQEHSDGHFYLESHIIFSDNFNCQRQLRNLINSHLKGVMDIANSLSGPDYRQAEQNIFYCH